jgi:hypothetical protein
MAPPKPDVAGIPVLGPRPPPVPPDIEDIPSDIEERLNDGRMGLIIDEERRWKARSPPPPIRDDTKPPNLPA